MELLNTRSIEVKETRGDGGGGSDPPQRLDDECDTGSIECKLDESGTE